MSRAPRFLLVVALAALFAVAVQTEFPLCPMASTFGVPCPGCGLTRATMALLRGDLKAALGFHPLVLLLTPLFSGFLGVALWELLRDAKRPTPKPLFDWSARRLSIAGSALLVLVLGVWLVRFAGYLGGPVPVTTFSSWLSALRR